MSVGDFSSRGEPREALVVQSMVTSGNYILPKSYNDSIPSKPPFFHWLGALVSKITGDVSELSVRLPSKLFSLLTLIFFVFFLGAKFSKQTALIFILLLSFSFEWLRAGISARVDMVHASTLACGLLSGFLALTNSASRYWVLTAILLGLSMLAKGPVAIIIPAIVFTAWVFLMMDRKLLIPSILKLSGTFLISISIGMLWYVVAYLDSPQEFFNKVWYENVSRMGGTMHDSPHEHSILYLIGVFFVGTLPWSPFVIYHFFKDRPKTIEIVQASFPSRSQFEEFALVTVIVVFLFYTIPDSKRGVYLLAAYPFLAALCAIGLDKLQIFSKKALVKMFCAAFCIVLLAQILIKFTVADRFSERVLAETLKSEVSDQSQIYSYGFEFYGASFYLRRKFLRFEDWSKTIRLNNSFIVYYKSDQDELNALLKEMNIPLQNAKEVMLGKKMVCIVKI